MIQTNISKIQYYGQKNERRNWNFRSFLKGLDMDETKVDAIVHEIYQDIVSQIDCKSCANCCKEMRPLVLEDEIQPICNKFGILKEEFKNKYLEKDEEEGEYIINKKPCPFLDNNQCSIYDIRPEDCKSFPHLHKEEFLSRLMGVIQNYSICPIVFNSYEKLKIKFKYSG